MKNEEQEDEKTQNLFPKKKKKKKNSLTGGVKPALKAMADAFALQAIEADVLYRNDDYVAADKAKAISKELTQLRQKLRGAALPLVEAFAIPDHVLRAPIGVSSVLTDPYRAYLRSTGFEG